MCLTLSSSSSGLQSLIPQFVHLDYLYEGQYRDDNKNISYEKKVEQENLPDFRLMLTYPLADGLFGVKMAGDDDIQGIYDNGSDAFFNFEILDAQAIRCRPGRGQSLLRWSQDL